MSAQLSLGVHPYPSYYLYMLSHGFFFFRFWVKKMFKLEPADSRLPMVSQLRQLPREKTCRPPVLTLSEQEVDMS